MRETILVECRVAISLQRIVSGNTLCTIKEVLGGWKCNFINNSKFCRLVRVHLQGTWFRYLAQEFEALYEISYIIGAIDGSHIPTLHL